MKNIKEVVQVQSDVFSSCKYCVDDRFDPEPSVADRINHYLKHNFKLLHLGTETNWVGDGSQLWHRTVAILGK